MYCGSTGKASCVCSDLHCRQKVTAVHKANIMKKADGLFLECCREVGWLLTHAHRTHIHTRTRTHVFPAGASE